MASQEEIWAAADALVKAGGTAHPGGGAQGGWWWVFYDDQRGDGHLAGEAGQRGTRP